MEYEKIGEAMCRWLDSQDVKPSDGVKAMATTASCMIATTAKSFDDLLEGATMLSNLVLVECIGAYLNKTKQDIR